MILELLSSGLKETNNNTHIHKHAYEQGIASHTDSHPVRETQRFKNQDSSQVYFTHTHTHTNTHTHTDKHKHTLTIQNQPYRQPGIQGNTKV